MTKYNLRVTVEGEKFIITSSEGYGSVEIYPNVIGNRVMDSIDAYMFERYRIPPSANKKYNAMVIPGRKGSLLELCLPNPHLLSSQLSRLS